MEILSKDTRKQLRKISKNLPRCYDKTQTILVQLPGTDKKYFKPQPKEVNHYNELEKIYSQFGQSGVESYIKAVYASIHNVEVKETEEAA